METLKTALEGCWYHYSFLDASGNLGNVRLDTQTEMIFSVPLTQAPKTTQLNEKPYTSFLIKLGQFSQSLQTKAHGLHVCGTLELPLPGQQADQSSPHRPLPTPGALTFSPANARELPWALWVWWDEAHTFLKTKCRNYSRYCRYMLGLKFAFPHPQIGCHLSYRWNQRGKNLKI